MTERTLAIVEVLGLLLVCVGVAQWSAPAALVVAGLLMVTWANLTVPARHERS